MTLLKLNQRSALIIFIIIMKPLDALYGQQFSTIAIPCIYMQQ